MGFSQGHTSNLSAYSYCLHLQDNIISLNDCGLYQTFFMILKTQSSYHIHRRHHVKHILQFFLKFLLLRLMFFRFVKIFKIGMTVCHRWPRYFRRIQLHFQFHGLLGG